MDSRTIVKTLSPLSNVRSETLPLHCIISSTPNTCTFKLPKSQENCNGFFTSDDTEISIFDAHKYYFTETKHPDFLSVPRLPKSPSPENRKTGLLRNRVRVFDTKFIKKWLFTRRRRGCCHGEKSVQVKESISSLEHNNTVSMCQESEFTEIASDNIVEIHHISKAISETDFSSFDLPRLRRISASGRSFIDGAVGFTFPISKPVSEAFHKRGRTTNDDPILCEYDGGSDASSDLFEIESL